MTDISSFLQEWAPRKELVAEPDTAKKPQKWSSCLLVVSSASGSGRAARLAPSVARSLADHYPRVVVVPTTHHGHAREILATEARLAEHDLAVVLGGDGAFSEALNGMLAREDGARVPLAQFPGGSGNAVAGNTLGVWGVHDDDEASAEAGDGFTTVQAVCEILGTRKLSGMDANEITCSDKIVRYSALVLSGGNNADIVRVSDDYRWTAAWFGLMFRYVVGVFVALYKYGTKDTSRRLRIAINGEAPVEIPVFGFSLYNCGRTTREAAFCSTPPDGGTLGFVAAHRYLGFLPHLKFLKAVKTAKPGSEVPNLFARTDVTSIKVEPAEADGTTVRPCYLGFDGNTLNGSDGERLAVPFSARVLPRAIEVVVA